MNKIYFDLLGSLSLTPLRHFIFTCIGCGVRFQSTFQRRPLLPPYWFSVIIRSPKNVCNIAKRILLTYSILRDYKNAPFYILCLFHMIDLRMFSLSFFIFLQNGPWFTMISICSCCSFWRNIDVSVFQQLSSDKCEFDSIWKQTLSGGSQMS